MKTSLIYLGIAIFIALLLGSCASNKITAELPKNNMEASKYNTQNDAEKTICFVQLKDGSIQYYQQLKLVTGIFVSPHLLADGKTKFSASDIVAYKDADHYAISQNDFYKKAKAHVATDVLPGFAVREVKGILNLYSLQFYGSGNIYKKYFLQRGAEGKIIPFSADLLNEYAKDNVEIMNIIKKSKKKINPKQILELVDNYNNTTSISKN
jgi:hypothetical protein